MENKNDKLPITGFISGALGLIILLALFVPKEFQKVVIPKWVFIIIVIVGGIIGSLIESYWRKQNPGDKE